MNMHEITELNSTLTVVREELIRATRIHGPMISTHGGYAIILEELDELWDDIKTNAPKSYMRAEAIQVAAMAIRFILDLTPDTAILHKREQQEGSS